MRLIDALARLQALPPGAFRTGDAAACLRTGTTHASQVLSRLATAGHAVHAGRDLWVLGGSLDPLALPAYLTDPYPCYVSLQSALYYHGMISQVPAVTYAVSTARTRRYATPLGTVSVHHVDPSFFFGFVPAGAGGARMALPEKALLDLCYLGPARTGLFRHLPEIELPRAFRISRARRMVRRIASPARRRHVERRLDQILGRSDKPPR